MPTERERDAGLLLTAILAIAASAVLVRWADAPAIALAFWRTLGGAVVLAPSARRSRTLDTRNGGRLDRTTTLAVVGAGAALAVHFATWLASLELTSVAASVTLVSTTPLFVALAAWAFGRQRPARRDLAVIGATLVGVAAIAGGDIGASGDQLVGDGLALVGAAAMGGYLLLGERARVRLGTASYSAGAYAVAAACLLPVAVVTDTSLWGYDGSTWAVIAATIVGPQLLGHTVLNRLLDRLGSLTISLALLAEPVGASLLGWLFLGEVPPVGAWIGAPIVVAALAAHLIGAAPDAQSTSRRRASSR